MKQGFLVHIFQGQHESCPNFLSQTNLQLIDSVWDQFLIWLSISRVARVQFEFEYLSLFWFIKNYQFYAQDNMFEDFNDNFSFHWLNFMENLDGFVMVVFNVYIFPTWYDLSTCTFLTTIGVSVLDIFLLRHNLN